MLINVIGVVLILIALVGFAARKGPQTTEGPKELTELFDHQIKPKRRQPFNKPFKKMVVEDVAADGMNKTVERYASLGVTRQDVLRWMKQK